MTHRLGLRFTTREPRALFSHVWSLGLPACPGEPTAKVDFKVVPTMTVGLIGGAKNNLVLNWGDFRTGGILTSNFKHQNVTYVQFGLPCSLSLVREMVSDWNWDVLHTHAHIAEWPNPQPTDSAGWLFGLKGKAGHALFSSTRILPRGPWAYFRDEARDITWLQLYPLEGATLEEQLVIAKPSAQLVRPLWSGGYYFAGADAFLSCLWRLPKPNFYQKTTQSSVYLLRETDPTPAQVALVAGTKIHSVYPEPVKQVAWVSRDEAQAARLLPLIWSHGMELRLLSGRGEVRLDDTYTPPPYIRPAWAQPLEAAWRP